MKLSFKGSGLPDHPTIRAAFEAMAGQKVHADTARFIDEAMRIVARYCAHVPDADPNAVAAIIGLSGMNDFVLRRDFLTQAGSKVGTYSDLFRAYDGESFDSSFKAVDKGAAEMLLSLQYFYTEKILRIVDGKEIFNHSFIRKFIEVNLDLHKKFSVIAQEPELSQSVIGILHQVESALQRRVTEKYLHSKELAIDLPNDPLVQATLEKMLQSELAFDLFRDRVELNIAGAKLIKEYNLSKDPVVIAAALCAGGLVMDLDTLSSELSTLAGRFLNDCRPTRTFSSRETAILVCATRIVRVERLELGKNLLETFSLQIQSAIEKFPDIGDAAFRVRAEQTLRHIDSKLAEIINHEAAARKNGSVAP